MNFDWKVAITHSGSTVNFENRIFPNIAVTGRENGIGSAVLSMMEPPYKYYNDVLDKFDNLKVYVKPHYSSSYTELFDGTIRDIQQAVTTQGETLIIKCKGLGEALEETHCSTNYGYTSQNDGISTVEDIIKDVLDNYVEKSFGNALNDTEYTITDTYVPTIDAGLSIPFINAPYQTNKALIDLVCQLDTAYRNGATAGPHYFVDVSGNLRIKTIGTQQADGGSGGGDWGIYYGGSNDAVSLYHGRDFKDYTLNIPTDLYANNVLVYAILRKPGYDYWTEDSGGSALWGNDALTSITDDNSADVDPGAPVTPGFVVGSHSVKFDPNGATTGYGYYPASADAEWDITKWGSQESIPTLNFYCLHYNLTTATTYVRLSHNDTARKTDYFYATFLDWTSDPNYTWKHVSIPIGPYWKTVSEKRSYRWGSTGTPVWSDIDSVEFVIVGAGADGFLLVDDLHFAGKIAREAVDTSEVTSYKERQHPLMSKVALDDSAIVSDDTGMAGALAYAELLRRVNVPRNVSFTVELKPNLKPGEYFKLYLAKTPTTYKINGVDFRTLQYTHNISLQGCTTTVQATDDVLNSFPLNKIDQRALLNEWLLENNEKAKNMQGANVDLTISHMRKEY